ncbi:MAG: PIN domain protein [Candidatus Bathyarchaeota archaeon BA1]|nr:MAG: PIN domain protein [Candidatus Bathyarchaeota archaeon BA1]
MVGSVLRYLVDLRVLMAYAFKGDPNHQHAEVFFNFAEKEKAEIYVATSIIFEAEAVWLAGKVDTPFEEWSSFISDIITSPVLNKIEINHAKLYKRFGGNLTYFDSFHAATSMTMGHTLITTDSKLLKTAGIPTKDLRTYTQQ